MLAGLAGGREAGTGVALGWQPDTARWGSLLPRKAIPFAWAGAANYVAPASAPMDLINIEGLELRCIVGLRSHERHREQPLRADIWLGLDLSEAGRTGRIADTADYAKVADAVASLLRFREYRLLEVAAEETAAFLFAGYTFIKSVRLRLQKPEALAGRARAAAVEIERTRGAFVAVETVTPFGSRTELLRTGEATIEVIWVQPGAEVELTDALPHLDWLPGDASTEARAPASRDAGEILSVRAKGEGVRIARCLKHEPSRPGP